jgi:diaminohydroxyphosphoribosylaminopyrimidine deaminase/5-amino-6-(5-phosphoribosylamino)uracil reductase
VVFDSRLRLPAGSRLAASAARAPVWVVTLPGADAKARAALQARGVRVLEADGRDGRVEVGAALAALRRAGLWSLMVEGGSELLGAFLRARAFDQVALFRGPLLLGGRGALPAFGGPDPARLADAARLRRTSPLVPPRSAARSPAAPEDGSYELWYPDRR